MLSAQTRVMLILPELFGSEGGIQRIGQDMLQALRRAKGSREAFPVVVANDGPEAAGAAASFGQAFDFTWCGGRRQSLRKARVALSSFATALERRPDVIVCGHVHYAPICRWLRRLLGIPYLVVTYGIDVWSISSRQRRRALEEASLVTALSRYTRDRLAEQVDLGGRLAIQPHAVRDIFKPGPAPAHLVERLGLQGKRVLLTVSRLSQAEQYKGYDRVMEALPEVARDVPGVTFLIVGDGDDLPRAKGYAEQRGLADRVIFAGAVPNDELPAYYNLSDLFVMPSKNEGLGIVYLEASACGKPVIAGSTGGARDALLDGELGRLVDPDDTGALARAIVETLTGRGPARLTDPQALRETTLRHFGFEAYADALQELVRRASRQTEASTQSTSI